MYLGELIKYLRLYILALGNQMGFSPRSSKLLYFTMLYLLEDATPANLPHQLLLYGVVTSRLDRTYMAFLIVDGRTHQFLTTDGEVRLCYVPSLATVLSIPIICCFHHASIPIYKNKGGSAVPNHYLQQPRIDWYEGGTGTVPSQCRCPRILIRCGQNPQKQTHLWFYCIMSIQSSWLCTWTQNRGSTERLSTYTYLTSLTEKTSVSLSPATVSSLETIAPAPSKVRERWGHLKSWKRIPGSTKHSDKWVTTGTSRLMWWNSWSSLHICERRPCQAVPQDGGKRQETHFQVRSRPVSPSPYQSTSKPHVQHVIHRVAL